MVLKAPSWLLFVIMLNLDKAGFSRENQERNEYLCESIIFNKFDYQILKALKHQLFKIIINFGIPFHCSTPGSNSALSHPSKLLYLLQTQC